MDHEISTLKALSLWQLGEIPAYYELWGHHLYFWARLGRILEIVAAFAVVIDLLGADRLTTIARELREWHEDPTTRAVNLVRRPRVALIAVLAIGALASIGIVTGAQSIDPTLPFTGIAVPKGVAFVVTALFMGAIGYLMVAFYFVLFELVSAPLADYMAQLLQRKHADKWLKLIALPVLTLAFFLDLLSS